MAPWGQASFRSRTEMKRGLEGQLGSAGCGRGRATESSSGEKSSWGGQKPQVRL